MADGTILRTLHWETADEPWAVAEIVHGLGEHGGRYETVAAAFTGEGIDTWSYDLRGNGGSGGRRGWVERWPILHDDLSCAWPRCASRILHGPSSCTATPWAVSSRLAMCSRTGAVPCRTSWSSRRPAWMTTWPDGSGRWPACSRAIVPKMQLANGVPAGSRSRDPGVDAASAADPLCSDTSTVRFGAEAFAEQDRVAAALAAADSLPIPTYVLHGSDDPSSPWLRARSSRGRGT